MDPRVRPVLRDQTSTRREALLTAGVALRREGDLPALLQLAFHAVDVFGASALKSVSEAVAVVGLGFSLYSDRKRAIKYLTHAVNLDPSNPTLLVLLAEEKLRLDMVDEAVQLLTAALSRDPLDVRALHCRGGADARRDQLAAGRAYSERALQLGGCGPVLYRQASLLYLKLNLKEKALDLLERGFRLNPSCSSLKFRSGLICLQMDRLGEATRDLKVPAELDYEEPVVHYYLAQAHRLNGDRDAAVQHLVVALDVSADERQGRIIRVCTWVSK
eukprot:GHVU01146289.1.p1 GENE.GHVU01146289.1~~GHVU01146289.1.p1  ORF type:complete len:274 (-),score=39.22 GHVU01146289.1:79-900(-)